jgi:hypothetical protein
VSLNSHLLLSKAAYSCNNLNEAKVWMLVHVNLSDYCIWINASL